MKVFCDRSDAGRQLGLLLSKRVHDESIVVVGLPRGGVVVAYEIARVLRAPLEVIVVRKVGVPSQPELAMGAIAEGGVSVVDYDVLDSMHVTGAQYAEVLANERLELERRVRAYRCGRTLNLSGRAIILVDDGVATGATARAAVACAETLGASRVLLAVPVASATSAKDLAALVDELIVLERPEGPFSVGSYYERFPQTSDREVRGYLARAQRWTEAARASSTPRRETAPQWARWRSSP